VSHDSRSVLTRPAPPPDYTLAYGSHPDQVIDVRVGGPTLVIFFHGGFWRPEYDRAHTAPLAVALVAAGFTVATPEYRRTGWNDLSADVTAAVAMAPRAADGPVVLAGHSAGGHLALWAAPHADVRAVVALAPVADPYRAFALDLDDGAVRDLLGGDPTTVPERYAGATPAVPLGCPILLVHGDRDRHVPVEFSREFAARATRAGDRVRLVELAEVDHFAVIDPQSEAWPDVVRAFDASLTC
jgi:dipeptidyl aminopeptidase/acylaminoacyl peptidase